MASRFSTRAQRPTDNPFLPLPRDRELDVTPFSERVKREHERGIYAELANRVTSEIDDNWLRLQCSRWLMPQLGDTNSEARSREARALARSIDADRKTMPPPALNFCVTDGSRPLFVKAVNDAVSSANWSELALLLMQVQLWAETLHRRNAPRPWWERAATALNSIDLPPEVVDLEPAARSEPPEEERIRLLKFVSKLLKEGEACHVRVPRKHSHEGADYPFWTWNPVTRCGEGLLTVEHPEGFAFVPGVGMVNLEDEGVLKYSFQLLQDKREAPGCLLVRAVNEDAPSGYVEPSEAALVKLEVDAEPPASKRVLTEEEPQSEKKKGKRTKVEEPSAEARVADQAVAKAVKAAEKAEAKKAKEAEKAAAKADAAAAMAKAKEAKKMDSKAKDWFEEQHLKPTTLDEVANQDYNKGGRYKEVAVYSRGYDAVARHGSDGHGEWRGTGALLIGRPRRHSLPDGNKPFRAEGQIDSDDLNANISVRYGKYGDRKNKTAWLRTERAHGGYIFQNQSQIFPSEDEFTPIDVIIEKVKKAGLVIRVDDGHYSTKEGDIVLTEADNDWGGTTAMLFTRNESDYEGESEVEGLPADSLERLRNARRRDSDREDSHEEDSEEEEEADESDEDDNIIEGEDFSQYTYRDSATGRRLTPREGKAQFFGVLTNDPTIA